MTDQEFKAILKDAFRFWAEDDAAPDAENLTAAERRIFGHRLHDRDVVFTRDDGDAFWKVFDRRTHYVIFCASYPGNSDIRLAKKATAA